MINWATWIGGYYDAKRFIREAKAIGVSRKVAPRQAQGMNFGDWCYCFRHGPYSTIIGAFRITRLSMPQEISILIREWLEQEGKVESVSDAPVKVYRECGSYEEGACTTVKDVTLGEIVKKVIEICKEKEIQPFLLLQGDWVWTANPPVVITPRPKPYRGFMHMTDEWMTAVKLANKGGIIIGGDSPNEVRGIDDYYKRNTVDRPDLELAISGN